jgi:hypothetical protein
MNAEQNSSGREESARKDALELAIKAVTAYNPPSLPVDPATGLLHLADAIARYLKNGELPNK